VIINARLPGVAGLVEREIGWTLPGLVNHVVPPLFFGADVSSFARRPRTARSDIDLMVIGNDLTYSDLYTGLQDAENVLHRQVNPTFLSVDDWRRKLGTKDSVIAKIDAQPQLFIVGSEHDLKHG
jgi:hypothetical protein